MQAVAVSPDGRQALSGAADRTVRLWAVPPPAAEEAVQQQPPDEEMRRVAELKEPVNAVAEFRNGKVTAWAPTQNPQAVQDTVAKALGLKNEDVTCNVTLLGGGFGRKSKPDYVAEAALLSKQIGKHLAEALASGHASLTSRP